MKRSSIVWIVVVVIVLIGAGIWYWSSSASMNPQAASNTSTSTNTAGGTGTPSGSTNPTSATTTAIILNTETTSTLGTFLVSTNGMTLYMSKADKAGVSNCTGVCATVWPPYTVSAAQATTLLGSTPGITGEIGSIKRADGTIQVTYNNLPLYFYEKDQLVGDAKGQNVGGFVIVNL